MLKLKSVSRCSVLMLYLLDLALVLPSVQNSAAKFFEYMDPSVNPCENFYKFACGGFEKHKIVPDDQDFLTDSSITIRKIVDQFRLSLEEDKNKEESGPKRLVKDIYSTCMNTTQIDLTTEEEMRRTLATFGGSPVLLGDKWDEEEWTLENALKNLNDYNLLINFILEVDFIDNENDTSREILVLSAPRFHLEGNKSFEDEFKKEYYQFLVQWAVHYGANSDEAQKEMLDVVNLLIDMSSVLTTPDEDSTNVTFISNELTEKYSIFPWVDFINHTVVSRVKTVDDSIVIRNHAKIENIFKLLSNSSKRTLANLITIQVIAKYPMALHSKLRILINKTDIELIQRLGPKPRFTECFNLILNELYFESNIFYVETHLNERIRDNVSRMYTNIRNGFESLIQQSSWMDEMTKLAAYEKLYGMDASIALPKYLLNANLLEEYYRTFKINSSNLLDSLFQIRSFITEKKRIDQFYRSRIINDAHQHEFHSFDIKSNSFYISQMNRVAITANAIDGYTPDRPNYVNYGAMGWIIGHEITHGFDGDNRKLDRKGDDKNWWDSKSEEAFLNMSQCFIDQYDTYITKQPYINSNVNGTRTLNENIADNGGAKAAYFAYNRWKSQNPIEPALPGFQQYNAEQMFWISLASTKCGKFRSNYFESPWEMHARNEFRISATVSNIPEFSKDFNCPIDSSMNPATKCIVW